MIHRHGHAVRPLGLLNTAQVPRSATVPSHVVSMGVPLPPNTAVRRIYRHTITRRWLHFYLQRLAAPKFTHYMAFQS